MCRVASRAPPNFPRGAGPQPSALFSRPGPGPGVPFPDESSDVIRRPRVHPDGSHSRRDSRPTLRGWAPEPRERKGRAGAATNEQVPWSAGPRQQAICTRRGHRDEERGPSARRQLCAWALGLCWAEGCMACRGWHPGGRPGAGLPGTLKSVPIRQRSSVPPSFAWTLLAWLSGHFPRTLVPPPARA